MQHAHIVFFVRLTERETKFLFLTLKSQSHPVDRQGHL